MASTKKVGYAKGERRDFIAEKTRVVVDEQLSINGCFAFKVSLEKMRGLVKEKCGKGFLLTSQGLIRAIRKDEFLKKHFSLSGFDGEEVFTFYSIDVAMAVTLVEKVSAKRGFRLALVA